MAAQAQLTQAQLRMCERVNRGLAMYNQAKGAREEETVRLCNQDMEAFSKRFENQRFLQCVAESERQLERAAEIIREGLPYS